MINLIFSHVKSFETMKYDISTKITSFNLTIFVASQLIWLIVNVLLTYTDLLFIIFDEFPHCMWNIIQIPYYFKYLHLIYIYLNVIMWLFHIGH